MDRKASQQGDQQHEFKNDFFSKRAISRQGQ